MTAVWAGIDSGKRTHHCVVIDAAGRVLLSQRVANDEAALLALIAAVLGVADGGEVVWATDLNAGGAALLSDRASVSTSLCKRRIEFSAFRGQSSGEVQFELVEGGGPVLAGGAAHE